MQASHPDQQVPGLLLGREGWLPSPSRRSSACPDFGSIRASTPPPVEGERKSDRSPYIRIGNTVNTTTGTYRHDASYIPPILALSQSNEPMEGVTTSKFVVLLRVSTTKQGADGLGIDAQKRDIDLFLKQQENPEVIAELTEVESGASKEREVLEEALTLCREHQATLLVQKVDRITRDLEVLARIVKDKEVPVKVACLPNADNFQIHLFGCLAAQEREFISTRTKAALAAARDRGVQLGNPHLSEMNRNRKNQAKQFADQHSNLIWSLRRTGKTLREICSVLNDAGITTRNGSVFHPSQVSRILKRSTLEAMA